MQNNLEKTQDNKKTASNKSSLVTLKKMMEGYYEQKTETRKKTDATASDWRSPPNFATKQR
jgi:hypothetical protein